VFAGRRNAHIGIIMRRFQQSATHAPGGAYDG
jgi:hypothetical protein